MQYTSRIKMNDASLRLIWERMLPTWEPTQEQGGPSTRTYYPHNPAPGVHAINATHLQGVVMDPEKWHSSTLVPTPDQPLAPLALPVNLGDQLWFLGYELQNPCVDPDRFHLLTFWRVAARPDGPRAIFGLLLAPDGQVAAQWDGLDVLGEGWREGDTFLQTVSFELPADLPRGQYWLQAGAYNPSTMERLPVLAEKTLVSDRLLLAAIRLGVTP